MGHLSCGHDSRLTFPVGFPPAPTTFLCPSSRAAGSSSSPFVCETHHASRELADGSACFSPALSAMKRQVLSTAANRRVPTVQHRTPAHSRRHYQGPCCPGAKSLGKREGGSVNNSLPQSYKVSQTPTVPRIARRSSEPGEQGASAATQPRWSKTWGGWQRGGTAHAFAARVRERFPPRFLTSDLLLQRRADVVCGSASRLTQQRGP